MKGTNLREADTNRQGTDRPDTEVLAWSVHPASEHPVKAVIGIFAIGMILGLIHRLTSDPAYCAVALVVLIVTLAPFYQKTTYRIDGSGVSRRIFGMTRSISWSLIRRAVISSRGVYLSRRKKECWNDRGGIYLMFGSEREEVLARIQDKVGQV